MTKRPSGGTRNGDHAAESKSPSTRRVGHANAAGSGAGAMAIAGKWTFAAVALIATPAVAQDREGLDLSGTMRLRYEAIANQPRAGFGRDDDLVNLRTTLLAKYQTGPFTIGAELWDSRVYGEDAATPVTTGEVNAFELVQAWVGARATIGSTKLSAQAGRFTLNIGSRRLVAADEYRNTTNGYTGLRADLATASGITATAIYVLPQQRRPDDAEALRANAVAFDHEGFDLVLWGGTAAKARALGPATIEASFYHLGERDEPARPTRDRSLDTYGGRVFRDPAKGKADGEVEAFYQSGSISASLAPAAARLPVSAWFVHASAGYSLRDPLNTRVSLQYDRASGDRAGGRYGRFDTLYGMRRADLAPAGLYNAVGRANISTPGARIEIAPSSRWDAFVTYHALWLAERTDAFSTTGVRDASGRSGGFAGHQIDSRFRWWLRPAKLRLELDGVLLTKGRFLQAASNAPPGGTTTYGAINLSASF
ncbi:alginate export family protein [Sphingomonas sp. H39-1-10]|uniref:alginate export family protein n=1 Tax=Sphingomonas pollutisoli TaxID=3030829 RepID=UPI0023B8CA0E|nr:alginate export family protein [Sphingomonas pollutisoli]MDF0486581.1 alginate export family protein [Sphingomonas pollutisoli]